MVESEKHPTRSERTDAVSVLVYGIIATVVTLVVIVTRAMDTFRTQGIAWQIEIDAQQIEATLDSGKVPVDGTTSSMTVIAAGVDTLAVTATVASLILTAAATLLVIACAMHIAWHFLRGRFFIRGTAVSLTVAGTTIFFAPCLVLSLDAMGRNGVLEALGIAGVESVHPSGAWALFPFLAVGVTVMLIAVAFRRGVRLQRETEGLV